MALTRHAEGQITPGALATDAQIGADITVTGFFKLELRLPAALALGERVQIVYKKRILSTDGVGTELEGDRLSIADGPQTQRLKEHRWLEAMGFLQYFIRQDGGTIRTYDYVIWKSS